MEKRKVAGTLSSPLKRKPGLSGSPGLSGPRAFLIAFGVVTFLRLGGTIASLPRKGYRCERFVRGGTSAPERQTRLASHTWIDNSRRSADRITSSLFHF